MTVSGTFYKNKPADHKRKLCLCVDGHFTAASRGRQGAATSDQCLRNQFCRVSWNWKLQNRAFGKQNLHSKNTDLVKFMGMWGGWECPGYADFISKQHSPCT